MSKKKNTYCCSLHSFVSSFFHCSYLHPPIFSPLLFIHSCRSCCLLGLVSPAHTSFSLSKLCLHWRYPFVSSYSLPTVSIPCCYFPSLLPSHTQYWHGRLFISALYLSSQTTATSWTVHWHEFTPQCVRLHHFFNCSLSLSPLSLRAALTLRSLCTELKFS